MNQFEYDTLINCVKILKETILEFPDRGNQSKHDVQKKDDKNVKFELIINRKGHLNQDNLSFLLKSSGGLLVRLDCSGAPHEDVPTPHLHIFDEEHDNGRIAVGLEEVDFEFAKDLFESISYFLDYTNIEQPSISLKLDL